MLNEDQLRAAAKCIQSVLTSNAITGVLTKSEAENARNALGYITDVQNGDMILSPWTTDDVKSLVDEDDEADGTPPVTDKEARAVLKMADDNHDAETGINWDVLRENLDMYREEHPPKA